MGAVGGFGGGAVGHGLENVRDGGHGESFIFGHSAMEKQTAFQLIINPISRRHSVSQHTASAQLDLSTIRLFVTPPEPCYDPRRA